AVGEWYRYRPRSEVIRALIPKLADEDSHVRAAAATALGATASQTPPENDEQAEGERGDRAVADAFGALTKGLEASRPPIRASGGAALSSIGERAKASLPHIIVALHDEDAVVREDAARAIGRMGPEGKEAVDLLADLLDDDEARVRWAAAGTLEGI